MSNKLPHDIAIAVKEKIFSVADDFNYLAKSRIENGKFIDDLVTREGIGNILSQFMKDAEIRIYIKDAVLNRYSKDKTKAAKPKNMISIIKSKYGFETNFIETDPTTKIELYKSKNQKTQYVIVAEGTMVKWETALRKALLYIPSKPFFFDENSTIHILLNIFAQHKPVSYADKKFLNEALERCGAQIHIFGEA